MTLKTVITDKTLEFQNEENTPLAILEFTSCDNVLSVTHTNVSEELRGQGMAGKLMEEFYQYVKKQDKKVTPICSYAVAWFEKNEAKQDVLAK